MFNRPVGGCLVSSLTGSGALASTAVLTRKRNGRHTVTVSGSGAMIGSKEDIEAKRGLALTDEPFTFPVNANDVDNIWYSGTLTLVEWF